VGVNRSRCGDSMAARRARLNYLNGVQLPYSAYHDALRDAGIGVGPAEAHGGVSGALSAGGLPAALGWLAQCCAASEADGVLFAHAAECLRALAASTWEHLAGSQMTFQPLLPEDTASLEERVDALAHWCHGFLVGLAAAGLPVGATGLTVSLREIVGDFAEISRAGLDANARRRPQHSEFDFLQLSEYVRVGAQLAFEELNAARARAIDGDRESRP
jgi:uncharacterized protein